ncbi:hypothetical protein LOTGIDRAFT_166734 [Lottia gigantea]|uniref:Sushi domain-containing protein n=1 Tax=Lottia gigantea TaxID=225164 RepID=V4BDZ0_LOTGI|nr:hypothetical protein LOTGIDRAFT_166734 [Lottia gigantea]ESO86999.1 hypothetical protein LOTGIDRAFT_166734 [Lottia gigantea]
MMFNVKMMLVVVWIGFLPLASSRPQSNMMRRLLEQPVCTDNPDISNSVFNRQDQCDGAKITCRDGFQMVVAMRCVDETWVYQRPICKPVKCLSDPEIANGVIDSELRSRDIGVEYNFTCNPAFTRTGNKGVVRCTGTGEWEADITCEDCFKYSPDKGIPNAPFNNQRNLNRSAGDEECESDDRCTATRLTMFSCSLFDAPTIFVSTVTDERQCIEKCLDMEDCVMLNLRGGNDLSCYLYNVTADSLPEKNRVVNSTFDFIAEKVC